MPFFQPRYLLWSEVPQWELLRLIRERANLLMPNRWKFRRKQREDWRTRLREPDASFHSKQETWFCLTQIPSLELLTIKHTEQLSSTDWRFETCRLFIWNRKRNVLIDSTNILLSLCTILSFEAVVSSSTQFNYSIIKGGSSICLINTVSEKFPDDEIFLGFWEI